MAVETPSVASLGSGGPTPAIVALRARLCGALGTPSLRAKGHLLRHLLAEKQILKIVGMDVSHRALVIADERLHLDPPRLRSFERTVFEFARPGLVVITTPNAEYNVLFEGFVKGSFRHKDHRFEWTRGEFSSWASGVAAKLTRCNIMETRNVCLILTE